VEPARPRDARTAVWRPILRQVLPFKGRMALATLPGKLARRALVKAGKAPGWLPAALARPLELLPAAQPPAPPLPEWTPAVGAEKGVVAFLEGCAMPSLFPAANGATVRLLARAGYRVWVPRAAGCCGAIHLHDGDLEGARAMARRNVAAFEGHGVEAVITNAGGCGAAVHEYGELLAADPAWAPRAAALAAKAVDLARFLVRVGLPTPPKAISVKATWHDPCHLAHGLGVRAEPRQLLAAMPGVTLVELPEADWCCGGAGSYTLLQPAMADKLLAHKVRHVRETGAEVLVTANPPCLMQIGRGLERDGAPVRLVHLAEFLDGFWA
jgi:glycolate oxidase iron-sulfur subunit